MRRRRREEEKKQREEEDDEEKEDEAGRARTRETTTTCNMLNSPGESNTSARGSSFTGGAFDCRPKYIFEENVDFLKEIIVFLLSEAELS